ncbi:MAG TPA: hypothetical protein VH092_24420 [Urbifossiella sp.]|nr:hypothetical protein [Urbifossiella sp.]
MPENFDHETVADILKRKRGKIKYAPLDPGSPSWDDVLHETWGEIVAKANRRVSGYKTFRKLLSDSGYDK